MQPHDTDPAAGRRQFLKLGGGAVLGAAFLAACGNDGTKLPAATGTTVPTTPTTLAPPQGTTPEQGAANDISVTRTLRSFELAAVATYGMILSTDGGSTATGALALPEPLTYTDEVTEVLQLLADRHTTHAETLVELVSATGGAPVAEANQGVLDTVVGPRIPALTTQRSVLDLVQIIESLGAATAGWAGGILTTAALRQRVLAIGAAAARQSAVATLLSDASGATAVPHATFDVSGPARLPAEVFLEEGQDGGDVNVDAEAVDPAEDDGESTGGDEGEQADGVEG